MNFRYCFFLQVYHMPHPWERGRLVRIKSTSRTRLRNWSNRVSLPALALSN